MFLIARNFFNMIHKNKSEAFVLFDMICKCKTFSFKQFFASKEKINIESNKNQII
jgi:hypothetical protein